MARVRFVLILLIAAPALTLAGNAFAGPTVYADTSGIDARKDLTDAEKQQVKDAMKQTIKENLEEAFGAGNVTVTDDPANKDSADRTAKTNNSVGEKTDKSGKKSNYYGNWSNGSSTANVYVGTYMDVPTVAAKFKKPDKSWDTAKLGKAMGTTAAHEIAHSYSAGHDDAGIFPNKMNTSNTPSQLGSGQHFTDRAKKTLQANKDKPPCATATDYKSTVCLASWWDDPIVPDEHLLHEPLSITTSFAFAGPLANMFDFGWWGIDTDRGATDGNCWGDFVYKSSMTGTRFDAVQITFFDGWTAHFVLRGLPGTPYYGRLFDVAPRDVMLSDWVNRPDFTMVARHIDLSWDVVRQENHVGIRIRLPQGFHDATTQFRGSWIGHTDYRYLLEFEPGRYGGERYQPTTGCEHSRKHRMNVDNRSRGGDLVIYAQVEDGLL